MVALGREKPRRTIARALARIGWRVSVASTGADAVTVARLELTDLIVVDRELGNLPDGSRSGRALKECGPAWHKPRLVLVASVQDEATMALAAELRAERVVVVADDEVDDEDSIAGVADGSWVAGRELWVTDDSQATRLLVRYSFERAGWRVREFEDISSLHDALSVGLPPKALILDIHLPDGNGLDHVRSLATTGAAIVMISNLAGPEQVERTFAAGAADIVAKPFDLRSLVARVEKAVRLTPAIVVAEAVVPAEQFPPLDIEPSIFLTHWG